MPFPPASENQSWPDEAKLAHEDRQVGRMVPRPRNVTVVECHGHAKVTYIVTDKLYHRHHSATRAIAERNRLREQFPDRADHFRVLTVIDEPNTAKLARDNAVPEDDA